MKVKANASVQSPIEAGLHDAVCYGIVDLGTQENEYQGQKKLQRQAILKFELLDEFDDEGKRVIHTQFYNISLNEKSKFRKHLRNWRGRDFTDAELQEFDVSNILNTNVVLNIIINEKGRAIIDGTAKYKKDAEKASIPLQAFDIDNFDGEFPSYLTEGVINIIKQSKQYKAKADTVDTKDEYEDDVPF